MNQHKPHCQMSSLGWAASVPPVCTCDREYSVSAGSHLPEAPKECEHHPENPPCKKIGCTVCNNSRPKECNHKEYVGNCMWCNYKKAYPPQPDKGELPEEWEREKNIDIIEELRKYPAEMLKAYGGKLPFVMFNGKADEWEKISIWKTGYEECLKLVNRLFQSQKVESLLSRELPPAIGEVIEMVEKMKKSEEKVISKYNGKSFPKYRSAKFYNQALNEVISKLKK